MFNIIGLKRVKKDLFLKKKIKVNILKIILKKKLKKIFLILGPCSLSNVKDFLFFLKKINFIKKKIIIIIRVYYEKPRTNIGWKGFIYDPYLDNSFSIIDSIYIIRKLFLEIINLKLLIGIECLNFYLFEFFKDCVSWICIGARTMQSQIHREFCSNLNCIVAIKNDTSGNLSFLKDSFLSIKNQHVFISFFEKKKVILSKGNTFIQFVLRGSNEPNFLEFINLSNSTIIDCSHMNSYKIAKNQLYVFENIYNYIKYYNNNINGIMIESYLKYGNQNIKNKIKGVSITDSCIDINFNNFIINKFDELFIN